MKNVIQNPKVIAATATVLLLACSIWISAVHQINGDLEERIKEERLKSESFLSEKLSIEKEITRLKIEFKNLVGQNAELDKTIFATKKELTKKEAEIASIHKETRTVKGIQKKCDELLLMKQDLEQQLAVVNKSLEDLRKNNSDLINTIAMLESRNKNLEAELNATKLATIDEIRIEAVKKKSAQLTATARKTRKMIVTFEIPAALQGELTYTITGLRETR